MLSSPPPSPVDQLPGTAALSQTCSTAPSSRPTSFIGSYPDFGPFRFVSCLCTEFTLSSLASPPILSFLPRICPNVNPSFLVSLADEITHANELNVPFLGIAPDASSHPQQPQPLSSLLRSRRQWVFETSSRLRSALAPLASPPNDSLSIFILSATHRELFDRFQSLVNEHFNSSVNTLPTLDTLTSIFRLCAAMLEKDVDHPATWRATALFLYSYDEPTVSIEALGCCCLLEPEKWLCFHNRGVSLMRVGRLDEALEDVSEALRLLASQSTGELGLEGMIRHSLGRIYQKFERLDEAYHEYSEALRLDPSKAEYWISRAQLTSRENSTSLEDMYQVVRLRPEWDEAHMGVGVELLKQERFVEAEREFSETIRLNSSHVGAYRNRISANFRIKEETEKDLLRIDDIHTEFVTQSLYGDSEDAIRNLCQATDRKLKMKNRVEDCNRKILADFETLIELEPLNPLHCRERALFLIRSDLDGAMRDISMAIVLNPDEATSYYVRAITREAVANQLSFDLMKLTEEGSSLLASAITDLQHAVRLDPSNGNFWLSLGRKQFRFLWCGGKKVDDALESLLKASLLGVDDVFHPDLLGRFGPPMFWADELRKMSTFVLRYVLAVVQRRMSPNLFTPTLSLIRKLLDQTLHHMFSRDFVLQNHLLWGLTLSDLNKSLASSMILKNESSRILSHLSSISSAEEFSNNCFLDLEGNVAGCFIAYHLIEDCAQFAKGSRLLRWVIKDGVIVNFTSGEIELRDGKTLNEVISYFGSLLLNNATRRDLWGRGSGRLKDYCEYLYNVLIYGIESFLEGVDHVTFVPDRSLLRVPFGCLLDEVSGAYFLEDHSFSICPSLHLLRSESQYQSSSTSSNVLLLCESTYIGLKKLSYLRVESSCLVRSVWNLSNIDSVVCLTCHECLPFQIEDCVNTLHPQYLHIAGHSAVEKVNRKSIHDPTELSTSDLLEPYRRTGIVQCSERQFLRARAIAERFDLSKTKLVYLSSCALGDGNLLSSGVNGFYRACMDAGCPTVVCALWPVLDKVSLSVSCLFYSELGRGVSPPSALRIAILKTMGMKTPNGMILRECAVLWGGFQVFSRYQWI